MCTIVLISNFCFLNYRSIFIHWGLGRWLKHQHNLNFITTGLFLSFSFFNLWWLINDGCLEVRNFEFSLRRIFDGIRPHWYGNISWLTYEWNCNGGVYVFNFLPSTFSPDCRSVVHFNCFDILVRVNLNQNWQYAQIFKEFLRKKKGLELQNFHIKVLGWNLECYKIRFFRFVSRSCQNRKRCFHLVTWIVLE